MHRVRLVHWHAAESVEKAERLRQAGFSVDADPFNESGSVRALRIDPPDAIVIDLSRLPSHGRAVGHALRQSRATRSIPLVFVAGEPDKVQQVRDMLPDATYTKWSRIARDLARAIAKPVREPVVPRSESGGYSGTPLTKKLGIKPGSRVGLIGAPKNFAATLGTLPVRATLVWDPRGSCDLVLCFARTVKELDGRLKRAIKLASGAPSAAVKAGNAPVAGLWVIWPKKSSRVASDLSESVVRTKGLAEGWVDFKVAAIDETWSGHRFAPRKQKSRS